MNELGVEVEKPVVPKSFLVQMRGRGQIALPFPLRQALHVADGDVFTLVQLDSLLLLAPALKIHNEWGKQRILCCGRSATEPPRAMLQRARSGDRPERGGYLLNNPG